MLEQFIENCEECIYHKYAEVHPERIHSDWTLEDAHDLDDFIEKYMSEEFETFINGGE